MVSEAETARRDGARPGAVTNGGRPGRRRGRSSRLVRWLAVALALALAAGCSSGDGADPAGAPGSTGTAATSAPAPEPPFAVGRRAMHLVDESRPTAAVPAAGVQAAPERTIELQLVYPAAGDPAGDDDVVGSSVVDAPPADGSFPLVVWAHGLAGQADLYVPVAERWAREGYVVALPTFPLSRDGIGHVGDVQSQPDDVSFVIDQVVGLEDEPLAGVVDGERIAVAGHSLGGTTVFGVAFNTCCLDERVDAAIAVAGIDLAFEGGDYVDTPAAPLLLVHGARDDVVSVDVGDAYFDDQPPPVTYLRLDEADHVNMFWGDDGELLETAVLAFLDAELHGDPSGMEALPEAVEASGRGELRAK